MSFQMKKAAKTVFLILSCCKGKLDLYLHLLHFSFISSGHVGDVSNIKFTLCDKNMMASPLLLCRNLHFIFKLVITLDTSLLGKIPNFKYLPLVIFL